MTDGALRDIMRYYTREAGVRGLEREIAKICRKVVKSILTKKKDGAHVTVNAKNLDKYLGVRKYTYGIAEKENQVGQVTGLAWTEVGGELLTIEAVKLPGKGKTVTTGKLGDVMQESIKAALSVVRARAQAPRRRRGLLPEARPAHPLARRCDAEGRSVGGHRDRHRDRVGAHRHPGALRRRDDGRDHAARRSAADRRPEGEAARGASRRHQDRADPGGEREGPGQEIPDEVKNAIEIMPVRGSTRCSSARSSASPSRCRTRPVAPPPPPAPGSARRSSPSTERSTAALSRERRHVAAGNRGVPMMLK